MIKDAAPPKKVRKKVVDKTGGAWYYNKAAQTTAPVRKPFTGQDNGNLTIDLVNCRGPTIETFDCGYMDLEK